MSLFHSPSLECVAFRIPNKLAEYLVMDNLTQKLDLKSGLLGGLLNDLRVHTLSLPPFKVCKNNTEPACGLKRKLFEK